MCQFFSFVVTRSKILYDLDNHSHTSILKKHGIEDKDNSPEFVRVEVLPTTDLLSRNPEDWEFKVDQDFRPDWFNSVVEGSACKDLLFEIMELSPKNFLLSAVRTSGMNIKFIKDPSELLQLEAVGDQHWVIQYIANPSEAVKAKAVDSCGSTIKYIDNPSLKIQLKAVINSYFAIHFIEKPHFLVKFVNFFYDL